MTLQGRKGVYVCVENKLGPIHALVLQIVIVLLG